MKVADLGEFGLIQLVESRLKQRTGTHLSIGDDCAILNRLQTPLVTVDALVENVHFRRDWISARSLGRKCMAVNVSDLAASGARPIAAFVVLALPRDESADWIGELYDGMEDLAEQYNFTIAGGDVVSASQLMISLTLVGELLPEANGEPLLRSTAQVGDLVCVTGTLGDSAAGLQLLLHPETAVEPEARDHLIQRHFEPKPRLETVQNLLRTNRVALHAGMDLSDGLAGDVKHIANRSGVGIVIDAEKIPLSSQLKIAAKALQLDPLDLALSGGEDYELLLCVAPEVAGELQGAIDTPLTVIGEVSQGNSQVQILENGSPRATRVGWRHF